MMKHNNATDFYSKDEFLGPPNVRYSYEFAPKQKSKTKKKRPQS